MKLKYAVILNSLQLMEEERPKTLKAVFAIKVAKIISACKAQKDIFEEVRRELVVKYGAENKETGDWSVIPEQLREFQKEVIEAAMMETDIDVPEVTEEELTKASEGTDLSTKFVEGLLPFLK